MARKAIITGGSKGIGAGIVRHFAMKGIETVFSYRNSADEAEALAAEVRRDTGLKCLALRADIKDAGSAAGFFEAGTEALGGVDILVNNAGITMDKSLMMMEPEEWREVLATNLDGLFNLTRAAVTTFLRQKGGSIINMTSAGALKGMAGQTNYAASKAGIIGFTKALSKECAMRKVTVNAIAPGFIETDMTDKLAENYKSEVLKSIPLGRFGKVEEVAAMAYFLGSEEARYVTGQVFVVDGGITA
jgi:3-oxoacyl-[acyl-carrier protein] reductase